ncbi:3-deoxy-D-manno-octulosonic acid transferase [Psychrosphaera sp. 1_MG-2023]|uniref:3-deoxy-D-manno-octulosonic acid transferase n=1 Tax=Psychrosphaera sp. 1_MG-2023 TaxID=3062643 RepID=UPI0026E43A39|nr:3-deoxy-D-manno-octulosonic acid transferase [Psychrosphaera sp. 1_MG-2023]MDO6718898.1 3-deoxy-D-manno-octulosonic acid transferase [Psychrosphaera sp. 1_MG-2023]
MKTMLARWLYALVLMLFYVIELFIWLKETFLIKCYYVPFKKSHHLKRDWQWGSKLGLLPFGLKLNSGEQAIIHCASMGEVVAATPLIKQLLIDKPELHLVITSNTQTGKQQVQRLKQSWHDSPLAERIQHCYLPLDLMSLMAGFLNKINPQFVIIMEVELWPNLIRLCHHRTIPTIVVNGRMTDKTRRGYLKLKWLGLPMIRQLSLVFVRNKLDQANYLLLGIKPENLFLIGNIKLDVTLPILDIENDPENNIDEKSNQQYAALRMTMGLSKRLVLLGGSTHLGEESLLVEAYKKLKKSHPTLALVIAPRHPQRFEDVFESIKNDGLNVIKYSQHSWMNDDNDVLVVDKMGMLSQLYAVCDVAFVGGSFANRGGHNPIEPAAFAKPVLMGPHIHNNPEICEVLSKAGGLLVCQKEQDFYHQLSYWLNETSVRISDGLLGRKALESHSGLIKTTLNTLYQRLENWDNKK